jgi:hypothetical protein
LKQRLLWLIGGTVALWLLLAGPAYLCWGEQQLIFSAVAAGLCLVPMAATLVWVEFAHGQKAPEQQLLAVLGGTGVCMAFVLAGGMVIYFAVPPFKSAGFWLWVVGFYLWTLTVKVVLVVRRQAASDRASDPKTPV